MGWTSPLGHIDGVEVTSHTFPLGDFVPCPPGWNRAACDPCNPQQASSLLQPALEDFQHTLGVSVVLDSLPGVSVTDPCSAVGSEALGLGAPEGSSSEPGWAL